VISGNSADVFLTKKATATSPDELAGILRDYVTTPPFLESLQEVAQLSSQSVEGFLRVAPGTVSRDDLMLEVPPDVQRQIANSVGKEVTLDLRLAPFPGAGQYRREAGYRSLESAGFTVTVATQVQEAEGGTLRIVGTVKVSAE
jgi:hypothetical protein